MKTGPSGPVFIAHHSKIDDESIIYISIRMGSISFCFLGFQMIGLFISRCDVVQEKVKKNMKKFKNLSYACRTHRSLDIDVPLLSGPVAPPP